MRRRGGQGMGVGTYFVFCMKLVPDEINEAMEELNVSTSLFSSELALNC